MTQWSLSRQIEHLVKAYPNKADENLTVFQSLWWISKAANNDKHVLQGFSLQNTVHLHASYNISLSIANLESHKQLVKC